MRYCGLQCDRLQSIQWAAQSQPQEMEQRFTLVLLGTLLGTLLALHRSEGQAMDTGETCRIEPGLLRPRTVMVLDGVVFAVFPWEHGPEVRDRDHAHEAAQHVNSPVIIYEVDSDLPAPPPIGTRVDPPKLQWVEVERYEPLHVLPS